MNRSHLPWIEGSEVKKGDLLISANSRPVEVLSVSKDSFKAKSLLDQSLSVEEKWIWCGGEHLYTDWQRMTPEQFKEILDDYNAKGGAEYVKKQHNAWVDAIDKSLKVIFEFKAEIKRVESKQ